MQAMRRMPSSRTATGDLVRETLTLLLQRLCGVYVAPCKEYDAQDQMNFNEALIDVFPATPPSAERFDKWKRYSKTTRKHGLEDPKKKTNINADDKLLPVLGGRKQVTMFELTKFVNQHLLQG
jgi:hypothetical protein